MLQEFHDHNDWKVSYNQLEFANQRKDFPAVQRCDVCLATQFASDLEIFEGNKIYCRVGNG